MADITDAQDNINTTPRPSTPASVNSIDDVPAFPKTENQPRTNQQQVFPAAIQPRLLGSLFSNNPVDETLGSAVKLVGTIPNNTSGSFKFTFSDPQGREIIGVPDVAFYINATDGSSQWPNATYGMGNMPTSVFNDWGLTDNKNVVVRATIRNNTGAQQIVYCYCRLRIIINPGSQFNTTVTAVALG